MASPFSVCFFFSSVKCAGKVEGKNVVVRYLSGEAFLASEKGPEGRICRHEMSDSLNENDCYFLLVLFFTLLERRPEAKSAGSYIRELNLGRSTRTGVVIC